MAGLLDFVNSPAGMGLLSAVAGGMAGARRGQPINSLGRGLVTGVAGYANAQDQVRRDQENALTKQFRELQMQQLQQTITKQKGQDEWKAGLSGVMAPKLTGTTDQGRQLAEQNAAFGQEGLPALADAAQYAQPDAPLNMNYGVDKQAVQEYMMQPHSPYADKLIEQQIMPKDPIKLGAGDSLYDPRTFKPIVNVPGKSTWQDGGDRLYEMDHTGQPTGNTLPKAMQPNMQFVSGGDYKPSGVFNPRTGQFTPTDAPEQTPDIQPDPMAPWANMPPKQANDMKARLYPNESKKLDDLREQVAKGENLMRDLDRFGELNRAQATGGGIDRGGFLPTFDEEKREMEAITARLAPQARPAGAGSTSDRDIGLYLQGLPGIDKQGNVNANIRAGYSKSVEDAKIRLDFAERYFAERGHLNGWQAEYEKSKIPTVQASESEAATIRQMRASGAGDAEIAQALNKKSAKPAKPAVTFDLPPNAGKYNGKTLTDTVTGKKFKSSNGKWVQVK